MQWTIKLFVRFFCSLYVVPYDKNLLFLFDFFTILTMSKMNKEDISRAVNAPGETRWTDYNPSPRFGSSEEKDHCSVCDKMLNKIQQGVYHQDIS